MSTSTWSDDRIEQLRSLWQEGQSASEVARALGAVTRNAVLGKLHRLGLLSAGAAGRPSRPRSTAPRRKGIRLPKAPVLAVPEPEAFTFADGTFATLATADDRMCRWPIGDPKDRQFRLCGHAPESGSCYCEVHHRRAHRPRSAKVRQPDRPAPSAGGL